MRPWLGCLTLAGGALLIAVAAWMLRDPEPDEPIDPPLAAAPVPPDERPAAPGPFAALRGEPAPLEPAALDALRGEPMPRDPGPLDALRGEPARVEPEAVAPESFEPGSVAPDPATPRPIDPAPSPDEPPPPLPPYRLAEPDPLAERARRALADAGIWTGGIRISVDDGRVVLEGAVDELTARERALDALAELEGVRVIEDRLRVEPRHQRTDAQVLHDVGHAISADPALDGFGVAAVVFDGVVTLTGVVDSLALERRYVAVAASVPGVRDVRALITVSPREPPAA